jgi:tRNA(Leu) C34 or U34 (ribose-2'-O)-methylase TrmL
MDNRIIIAGLWELSWDTPMMESRHWELLKREFLVDKWLMSPVSGIKNRHVIETASIEESLALFPDYKVVWITEAEGGSDLESFVHPEKVIYVFGKTNFSPFANMKREGDLSIKIKTPANKGLLLSPLCASVILYDRIRKNGFNNCR